MITSLLPGLRDLRTPLAAGYLWLLSAWLVLRDEIDMWKHDDRGIAADLVSTLDGLGPGGRVVAISFLAYIIGSLSLAAVDEFIRRSSAGTRTVERFHSVTAAEVNALVGEGTRTSTDAWDGGDRPDDDMYVAEWRYTDIYVSSSMFPTDAIESLVRTWTIDMKGALERVGEPEGRLWELVTLELFGSRALRRELRLREEQLTTTRDPPQVLESDDSPARPSDADHLLSQLTSKIADEYELIAYSLMDEKSDFFEPIDRLRAEIELRTAIAPPIVALVVLLSVSASVIWLLAAVVPAGVIYQTRVLRQERIDLITAALTTKRTRSPTLNRLEAAVASTVEASRHRTDPAGVVVGND